MGLSFALTRKFQVTWSNNFIKSDLMDKCITFLLMCIIHITWAAMGFSRRLVPLVTGAVEWRDHRALELGSSSHVDRRLSEPAVTRPRAESEHWICSQLTGGCEDWPAISSTRGEGEYCVDSRRARQSYSLRWVLDLVLGRVGWAGCRARQLEVTKAIHTPPHTRI